MTNTEKLVALGRYMISTAPRFQDDQKFNAWARVGQLLTETGTPFGKKFAEFDVEDQAVVREGAAVCVGKIAMPEQMIMHVMSEHKRTRKPRMTQVVRKRAKPRAVAKKVAAKAVNKADKRSRATVNKTRT